RGWFMAKRTRSRKKGRRGRSGGVNTVSRTVTPRQKEILRLVAQGLTNREIAHHLGISVRTVEVHRFNLMRRLKVRNVAQLLRQALLLRLLPKSFMSR
ncbi:MAG: LuxR C-terminal-related transcriptional regulator, partial [Nitrospiraceae bacterium]